MKTTIIGHTRIKSVLEGALTKRTHIPSPLLLSGIAGIGKNQLLEDFLQNLLCSRSQTEACGQCHNCKLVIKKAHPDVFFFPRNQTIKIDQIRSLSDFCYLPPIEGSKKFLIIPEIEKMNINAANSFLKLLEEPPSYLIILATTSNQGSMLDTILSRFMVCPLQPLSSEEFRTYLSDIGDIPNKEELLFLELISRKAPAKARELIRDRLIFTLREEAFNGLESMIQKDDFSPLYLLLEKFIAQELEEEFYTVLFTILRDLSFYQLSMEAQIVNQSFYDRIKVLSERFRLPLIWDFLEAGVHKYRFSRKFYQRFFLNERFIWEIHKGLKKKNERYL